MSEKVEKSDDEWREKLSPDEFAVCREKATEPAFTGKYCDHHARGTYICVACGGELFRSDTKFESGSGWPSFYEPARPDGIEEARDTSHGTIRTEVMCANCGSHLGHVFPDGPQPTGQRYCINSLSLDFNSDDD